MNYIGNAFSLGMLDFEHAVVDVQVISEADAVRWYREHAPESCVGHADTALLLSALLGAPVEMRRSSTSLRPGDRILIAQYNGPRLPEGARSLPDGARIRWMLCSVRAPVAVFVEGGALSMSARSPEDRESVIL